MAGPSTTTSKGRCCLQKGDRSRALKGPEGRWGTILSLVRDAGRGPAYTRTVAVGWVFGGLRDRLALIGVNERMDTGHLRTPWSRPVWLRVGGILGTFVQ